MAAVLVFVPVTRGDLKDALCVLQGVSFLEVYTLSTWNQRLVREEIESNRLERKLNLVPLRLSFS